MFRFLLGFALVGLALCMGSSRTVKGPPPPRYRQAARGFSKDVPDNYKAPPPAPAFSVAQPVYRPFGQAAAPPARFAPLAKPVVLPQRAFIKPGPPSRWSKDVPDNYIPPTIVKSGPPPRRFVAPLPPAPVYPYLPPAPGFLPPAPQMMPSAALPTPAFPMFPNFFFPAQPTAYPTEPPRFFDRPEVKKEEEEENKS